MKGGSNMLGIKKQFIKSMIKLEVVGNAPGRLQIYVAQIKKIQEEYKHYQVYAENAILMLNGVQDVDVDYLSGVVTIKYNADIVNPQQIYKWIQVIIDLGIDYYDELKAIWEKDGDEDQKVEEIWTLVKPALTKAIKNL